MTIMTLPTVEIMQKIILMIEKGSNIINNYKTFDAFNIQVKIADLTD
jgi:hypothetical protein